MDHSFISNSGAASALASATSGPSASSMAAAAAAAAATGISSSSSASSLNTSASGNTDFRDPGEQEALEKIINEEFRDWKKHSAILYDLLVSQALEWPTLTTQWFPDVEILEGKDYTVHRLLMGTNTSNMEQNYLQIAHVQLPRQDVGTEASRHDEDRNEYGGFGGADSKIVIQQRIPHDGEVNRARYMPQKPDIIATKTATGEVHIFNRTLFPSDPTPGRSCPTMRLLGNTGDGFGVAWSPHDAGRIISCGIDSKICEWDISAADQAQVIEAPLNTYQHNSYPIGDVAWHLRNKNVFASVDDGGQLLFWDLRGSAGREGNMCVVPNAHRGEIYSVDFNPCTEHLLATGGSDQVVRLWDMRCLKTELHSMAGHEGDVQQVSWSPLEGHVLASSGKDRRVIIWDLTKIGAMQTSEEAEDGVPELLFMHAGHTGLPSEFAWNRNYPWALVSAAEDNILQIWQMSRSIYDPESLFPGDISLE